MAKARISLRTVEKLQPGQTIWDEAVRGFGVRKQKNLPVYVLKYRFKRRQRFVTIGPHGSPWSPEDARAEARRLLGLLASKERPRDPAYERDLAASEATFADLANQYLVDFAEPRKKARSVAEDRRNLHSHILPTIGHLRHSDITRPILIRLHAKMKDCPVAANRCLALISKIFTTAERMGHREIGTNPCRGIERYKERPRDRHLSDEEIRRLGKALMDAGQPDLNHSPSSDSRSEDWRALACIKLLLYTGARLSEILTLKWSWINWDRGCATLPDSKTGPRELVLSTHALSVLHTLKKTVETKYPESDFVLPGAKGNAHFIGIQKPWQRIRQAASLTDTRLHDLRHSFASTAVSSGDSLYIVGSLLGHRNALTTQRYAHLALNPMRDVADRTAGKLAKLIG